MTITTWLSKGFYALIYLQLQYHHHRASAVKHIQKSHITWYSKCSTYFDRWFSMICFLYIITQDLEAAYKFVMQGYVLAYSFAPIFMYPLHSANIISIIIGLRCRVEPTWSLLWSLAWRGSLLVRPFLPYCGLVYGTRIWSSVLLLQVCTFFSWCRGGQPYRGSWCISFPFSRSTWEFVSPRLRPEGPAITVQLRINLCIIYIPFSQSFWYSLKSYPPHMFEMER